MPSSSKHTSSSSHSAPVHSKSASNRANGKRKAQTRTGSAGVIPRARSGHISPPPQQPARRVNEPPVTVGEDDADSDVEIVEEEPIDELYVSYTTTVVGVQYYGALVSTGQEVNLVREFNNRLDFNAIKVTNMSGEQVGHVPREVASKLAPLIDGNVVRPEGVINSGNMNGRYHTLPMTINIFGDTWKRAQIEPRLFWATEGRGFPSGVSKSVSENTGPQISSSGGNPVNALEGGSHLREQLAKATELREILNSLEKVNNEERRSSLLDQLCSTDDVLELPEYSNPPGTGTGELTIDLLRHQRQALQWCYNQEYLRLPMHEGDKPVHFWLYKNADNKPVYYNMVTKTPLAEAPVLGRGAVLGDSMGLGKTLTMLSLIVATKNDVPTDSYSASTLIVVPLSIISNWQKQIQDHCTPGTLRSIVYYGDNRSLTTRELEGYDVVITTYQTVAGEHVNHAGMSSRKGAPSKKKQRRENSLMKMRWKRAILDEGHIIRNDRTQMAQAVFSIAAQRRWVLTGTPIINSPSDIGSLVQFLQICTPLDSPDGFKRWIIRPLKNADPSGTEVLRALMAQICLRRTKEMQDSDGNPLVPLPPVEMTVVRVALHPSTRTLYDRVEQISRDRIGRALNRSNGDISDASVTSSALSMLTRLRQLALHPGLIPSDYVDQLMHADEDETSVMGERSETPAGSARLQARLARAIEDNEECPLCMNVLDNPRIARCRHRFCLACITEYIKRTGECPMDHCALSIGDLTELTDSTELRGRCDDSAGEPHKAHVSGVGSSAKIEQLVHLLSLTPKTEKSLVFSQFTAFLDKIEEALDVTDITYTRFDGQMSARQRQETLDAFCQPLCEDREAVLPAPLGRARLPLSRSPSKTSSIPVTTRRLRLRSGTSSHNRIPDEDIDMLDGQDLDYNDDFMPGTADDGDDNSESQNGGEKERSKRDSGAASRGKGFSGSGRNPRVMLISLKAGSLGLNLTAANNVFLMDPWWQESIESQAIDRCNRIGQTKPVHIFQLIAEDTVESKVLEIQDKKKNLVKQAFAGMKNKETQRQKKEARMQDLIQLFGVRLAASQA